MNEKLAYKLKNLPEKPGVYIMKDISETVIYVGKAISLKNRVRQYFQSLKHQAPKVAAMVANIEDFEYIVCGSEVEALVLECNLIKKHRPRYNILLKDDKHYPYIRMDLRDDFPRADVVRKIEPDGAKYFGPFTSAFILREVLACVYNVYPLRTCKKDIARAVARGDRPCLNYQLNKCKAPCAGNISKEEYAKYVDGVVAFVQGKYEDIVLEIDTAMQKASEAMEYERAAELRDRRYMVENMIQYQRVSDTTLKDTDIIALVHSGDSAIAQIMFKRGGKIVGGEHYELDIGADDDDQSILRAFLQQFYENAVYIPAEIIIPYELDEMKALESWFHERRGRKVVLINPKKGEKAKALELARQNASEAFIKRGIRQERDWEKHQGAMHELAKAIGISTAVSRLEAFDISNTQGMDSVASMVVFIDGKPSRKHYRRFRIKTVEGADDFASMAEVVGRRFRRMLDEQSRGVEEGFSDVPDIIIIDGGKGQLNAAGVVLDSIGLDMLPRIGLAKRNEEIFLPGESVPVVLKKRSPALHLLQRIRDEAHRFAITYHRSLRGKTGLQSELDNIKGVGPKKKTALLKSFRSIEDIREADVEKIKGTAGLDAKTAQAVYDYFNE